MIVKIESLTFGGPFEAEVESGSVARGRVTLVGNGATYLWQPKSGKWLDMYATPEFKDIEYEIAEVEDPTKVKPTALMDIIGNIPAGEWSKISGMANEEIKAACNVGLPPVNKAQVIRCLYAFERYAREKGLIESRSDENDKSKESDYYFKDTKYKRVHL